MFAYLFRLLLFFFAITLIRSVVAAVARAFRGTNGPPNAGSPASPGRMAAGGAASGDALTSTLLHQDPVCGTYVAAGSSFRKICKGQVYHFCSEECRDRFEA
jgi:YHS domain-containing protein